MFDLSAFQPLIDSRYISVQKHPFADLYIYNYTAQTQYERFWNDLTIAARGLILDAAGKPVARPFAKFFNVQEHAGTLPNEPFEVYEKMDGSLGILYFFDGKPQIATRGSFQSEQSERANQILKKKYADVAFDPNKTYLFEIIYPENRIVVDYGGREDLILLAVIDTATGRDLPLEEIGFPVVKRYHGINDLETLRQIEEANKEGFVIKYESGFRLKFKFEEYVRLHKILTGVNSVMIWEYLKEGKSFDELLETVPDEFYQWVQNTRAQLLADYQAIEKQCFADYKVVAGGRKANALYYQTCSHPSILFRMLDGRPYDDIIWKMLRPRAVSPFREYEDS